MTRILVIEDEPVFQTLMKSALKKAGYEVMTASDGEEGMRLFTEQPYDMVITDILMPNKEGLETILELTERAPEVKIIAFTGGGIGLGNDLLKIAQDFGAHRALRKPFQMKQLVEIVQDVLNEEN